MKLFQKALILFSLFHKPFHFVIGSNIPKTLDEIYEKLMDYSMEYPNLISLREIGRSYEDRPIYCVKIHESVSINSSPARAVIDFGVHGREWAGPASALYVIDALVRQTKFSDIVRLVQWFIIPVLNPDGYHYSITKDRVWRKNRRPLQNSSCVGVDLNRNYPVGWDKGLSVREKWCDTDYSGPWPLSEPETQVLGRVFEQVRDVDAYLSVHSCAQCIMYPYSSSKWDAPPEKLQKLLNAAHKMKIALENVAGHEYAVQRSSDLEVIGGASDDYAFDNFGIPIVLTLELGFTSPSIKRCFFPNPTDMDVLNRECLAGIDALGHYLASMTVTNGVRVNSSKFKERKLRRSRGNYDPLPWPACYYYLVVTVWVFRNSVLFHQYTRQKWMKNNYFSTGFLN